VASQILCPCPPAAHSTHSCRRRTESEKTERPAVLHLALRNRTALATKESADRNSIFTGPNGSQRDLSNPAETVYRHEHLRPSDPRQGAEAFHGLCAIFLEQTEHSSIDRLRSGERLAVSSHGPLLGNRTVRSTVGDTYVLACKYAPIFPACNKFAKFSTRKRMRGRVLHLKISWRVARSERRSIHRCERHGRSDGLSLLLKVLLDQLQGV
jgi:hypothetical protein